MIDLLGIPDLSDNVKKKYIFVSHLVPQYLLFFILFKQCLTLNCRYKSQSKTCTALTGYLKPKESEEKRLNSNDPHHGDTGITGGTTRRLTDGKISSPSQPYYAHHVCKASSVISSKSPSRALRWSSIYYTEP